MRGIWPRTLCCVGLILNCITLLSAQEIVSAYIDDNGDTIRLIGTGLENRFCLGECYQFVGVLPRTPSPNIDYLDSVWWTFNIATPRRVVGRTAVACFDTFHTRRDTITRSQMVYDRATRNTYAIHAHTNSSIIVCRPIVGLEVDRRLICQGESVLYTDRSRRAPESWLWEFEGGEPGSWQGERPPPIHYDVPGTYAVRLRASNSAGEDTLVRTEYIVVVSAPRYSWGYESEIVDTFGKLTRLQSCYEGDTYEWFPAEGLSCTDCPSPELRIGHEDLYRVVIGTEAESCFDTCYYRVEAIAVEEQVFFPDAFTPNGDGINDRFEPQAWFVTLEELRIYDRWGNEVYMHKGSSPVWDGRFRGKALDSGTYVFYAVGWKEYSKERVLYTGELQLIR
jgi:gliding motility-associated-like protein